MKKYSLEYARETFGKHIAENEVVAIDGKTIRRPEYVPTGENKRAHKAAHVVSAWAHSLGVCFGQVKTEEKSNEITAIPELLDLLDLKGMIITIDAMGCQKKIVENNLHWVLDAILDEDYCLVRKDNTAANLSVLRKIVLNILKQVDFSDIVKAKKMPLLHKQHLCNKREDCLDRVLLSL